MRIVTPYDINGNLARAYNREVALSPPGSYICFKDRDVILLDAKYGHKMQQIIDEHGDAFYTVRTNRTNCKWQKWPELPSDNIRDHATIAKEVWEQFGTEVTEHSNDQLWSGHMMIVPVDRWLMLPEDGKILGIDNQIHRMAKAQQIPVRLMCGIYVYHIYSFHNGGHRDRDKSHLI